MNHRVREILGPGISSHGFDVGHGDKFRQKKVNKPSIFEKQTVTELGTALRSGGRARRLAAGMAVKTGNKKDEVAALQGRIALGRAALRTHLPDAPLGNIHLVCCCSNCIEDSVFEGLCNTPISALTPQQVSFYFGGAGVLAQDTNADARQEAFAIYFHVLDALAEAVLADKAIERDYARVWDRISG